MNNTPNSNRKHIIIYGKTNAGKSSLINKITGQEVSLVSSKEGTTTDLVQKAMELIPVGPVLFIDTAGLGDNSELGDQREKITYNSMKKADMAIYLMDINDMDLDKYNETVKDFKKYNIPYLLVINKIDTVDNEVCKELKKKHNEAIFISLNKNLGIDILKNKIIDIIKQEDDELSIIGGLLPYDSKVILVVPIDSEAPKGRLILPQVQCIRDCLDNGIKSYIVRDTELESALKDIKDVDLVITDSQAFKKVSSLVPMSIKLTSFSMLFARQKGDINKFIEDVQVVRKLKPNDNILVAESCTHNVSHEDISRVKIPRLLNKYVGGSLNYTYCLGYDFPEDLSKYDLVIHCGGCMINRKTIINRVKQCAENNIPITNYGVILSFLTDTLERSKVLFDS